MNAYIALIATSIHSWQRLKSRATDAVSCQCARIKEKRKKKKAIWEELNISSPKCKMFLKKKKGLLNFRIAH